MVGVAKYDCWQESGRGKDLQCCVHGRPCPFAQPVGSEMSDSEKDRQQAKATNGYDEVALPQERRRHSPKRCANIAKNLSEKSSKHRERNDRSIRRSGSLVKGQKRYSQKYTQKASLSPECFLVLVNNSEKILSHESEVSMGEGEILGHRVGRHRVQRSSHPKGLQMSSNIKKSSQGNARADRIRCAHCRCEHDTNTQRYEFVPAPSPLRSCGSTVRTAKCPATKTSSLCNVYIGVLTQREAEDSVVEPTSFKLYHKLPAIRSLGEIPPKLPLMIVYRNDNGMHYHYGIKERRRFVENADNSGQVLPIISFQVDYGDTQAPIFTSIRSLVHYYTVYSQLRRTDDGGNVVDIFPRWHRCRQIVGDEDE
uniref:SH2 domain-containing protein n=1 Tax=Ascaris lumbricoides TaxID=6252 RepID=A0A9J2P7U6_ASCLU